MFEIVYTRQALRILRRLPHNLAQRIRDKLALIAADPYGQHNNVTKLQNRSGFRLRVGDWCVIYDIQAERMEIIVMRVASRGEVYR